MRIDVCRLELFFFVILHIWRKRIWFSWVFDFGEWHIMGGVQFSLWINFFLFFDFRKRYPLSLFSGCLYKFYFNFFSFYLFFLFFILFFEGNKRVFLLYRRIAFFFFFEQTVSLCKNVLFILQRILLYVLVPVHK